RDAAMRQQLEQHPEDATILADLGVLCADDGRFGEGRDLLERAIELDQSNALLHVSAAGMAANDGDLDAAESAYRKALSLQADMPLAHVGLGQLAEAREQFSTAEEHFEEAVRVDPENADALLGLARLRMEQGHIEQAVQMFVRVTQLYPQHVRALAGYGQALMLRGTPEQAARPLKRALELDESLHGARLMLAHVELSRGNITAAEKAYRQVLRAQPGNGDGLAGLADALRAQGRMEEAFMAYDAARKMYPDAEELTTLRATCQGAMGHEAEAVEDLRQFMADHPRCKAPRLLLADIYRGRGQLGEAAAMWQEAVDKDDGDALAHAELAILHERRGDFEAADNAASGSTEDNRPSVRLLRARAALRKDDTAAAQRELLALKGAPLVPPLRRDRLRLLGLVHDRASRWAEAVLAFREAQRIEAGPLPMLVDAEHLRPALKSLLAEPELSQPRVAPPVLLMGLPGSGIERVAALLADQPGVFVREDRFGDQPDFFADANDMGMLTTMSQGQLGVQARRYARVQERHVKGNPACIIDWLPVFDARMLPVIKLALPGVRAIIVDAEPRAAYLRWLAFGWQRRLRMQDSTEAARWWNLGKQQLDMAAEHLPVVRVDGDALLQAPDKAGAELAQFLDLKELSPGPLSAQREQSSAGLPIRFAAGHEDKYREVLAEAFAALEG
ncbi:MAG: tetratricopeptide repeat protein, partial [Rhodanobacteraceae bacterium]